MHLGGAFISMPSEREKMLAGELYDLLPLAFLIVSTSGSIHEPSLLYFNRG
jgi:hypothetical protein